jgi:hypothetical protein
MDALIVGFPDYRFRRAVLSNAARKIALNKPVLDDQLFEVFIQRTRSTEEILYEENWDRTFAAVCPRAIARVQHG